ncbi:MAG: hypothetical protein KF832_16400 [Caldilineaceae bacterium]|nr:hypothetical protein [Caldilineaceae bacterium]
MAKETVQRFNLQTMSGVFPGTRTSRFQRVQVEALTGQARQWLQLAWYDDPAACVAYPAPVGATTDEPQPLLHLAEPLVGAFNQKLQDELLQQGLRLISCGSCRFWQPSPVVTPDELPTGTCAWQPTAVAIPLVDMPDAPLPPTLALQSALALACPRWQSPQLPTPAHTPTTPVDRQAMPPMRKVAESAEIRLPVWRRLWKRLAARWGAEPPRDWATLFLERSGVGAGTEPCFVCQARIANLGALTVATPEGDKQTFSVWRCRHCYTLYLNNWIDRWERLDNLETEETYYRLAPAEAKLLLTLIYGVVGGEHPRRRQERDQERAFFLNFIRERQPLSHQIRQGR